jgi:DNA-binding NarL/FixJ family response regulator
MNNPARGTHQPARVIIADDHELARTGLRAMLSGEDDLIVIGEATNGIEALELCRILHPDLVLLDIRMPGTDGVNIVQSIKQECKGTNVIMVTMYEDPNFLIAALRNGASGYLLKDTDRHELLLAVRQVLHGETFLNTDLTHRLITKLANEPAQSPESTIGRLTPREQDVLQLLAHGHTNRDIAQALTITPGTVKVHVQRIIHKLHVSDRTQAAIRALELGLIP